MGVSEKFIGQEGGEWDSDSDFRRLRDGRQELMFGVFALFADDHDEKHGVVFRIRYTRSSSARGALLLGQGRPALESACA